MAVDKCSSCMWVTCATVIRHDTLRELFNVRMLCLCGSGAQQAYIQPKGVLPWFVRAVWRRGASPESYCWIISNTTSATAISSTVTINAAATICNGGDSTAGTNTAPTATVDSTTGSIAAATVGSRETDKRSELSLSLQSLARHNAATESINLGDADQLNSTKQQQLKRHSSSSSGTNTQLHTGNYNNTADDSTAAQRVVRVPRVASVSDVSDTGNSFCNGSARGCTTGRSSAYSSSAIGSSSSSRGSRSIVKSCAKQSWSAPREIVTALAEGLATGSSSTATAGAAAVHCDELAADFVQDTRCVAVAYADVRVLATDALATCRYR
jgi:hypothetical protein